MKTYFLRTLVVATLAIGLTLSLVQPALAIAASAWKPGRIIDDSIFYNKSSMTIDQIQQFLNSKVPVCDTWGTKPYAGTTRRAWAEARGVTFPLTCLKDYHENSSNGQNNLEGRAVPAGAKSAANIVWDAAQEYSINPQVILAIMEREQGLVTDDWPFPVQYKSAMGYNCPDSGPNHSIVCSGFAGFHTQVNAAAWQLRRYATNPNEYNYVAGRNNFIQWSPQPSCGGTQVFIENQATAALYIYAPYQPNQAALNNMYGTGDSCSSYANRNFWRNFNDWFGASTGDGFVLAISDDPHDLRQWVLYGTIKQYVPDAQTKRAWGLTDWPLATMSSATLNAISTGPPLDRLMRETGSPTLYFVDAGKRFKVPWESLLDTWNLQGTTISTVSPGLYHVTAEGGILTNSVKDPGSSDIYMLDGGVSGQTVIRKYQSDTVRQAWEGDNAPYTIISNDYWDRLNNAIGAPLTSTKISHSSSEYQVVAGRRLRLNATTANLYPGTAQSVSAATVIRLADGGRATHLVRAASSPTMYLVDNGQKHQLLWPDQLAAWSISGMSPVIVNDAYITLLPSGSAMNSYIADGGGQLYIIDGDKTSVPSALDTAYRNASAIYSASPSLMDLFPTSNKQATGFVKSVAEPQVYLLDNSGKRRHLEWADKVSLFGGYKMGITTLSPYIINSFGTASRPDVFVSDGTAEYVMENGKKWTVNADSKSNWGLGSPQVYTDGTLSRFAVGGALDSAMSDNEGGYYLIRSGAAYGTADTNIAEVWSLTNAPARDPALIRLLLKGYMLTRFVQSSTDNRVFIINNGQWFNLSANQQANLKVANQPMTRLNPSLSPNTITDWTSVVVKNSNNDYFVIDAGGKRYAPNATIRNQWTNNGAIPVPTVSNGFLALLPSKGIVERAIKGSAPQVYFVENNTKRHILYPDTYNQYYAPYAQVSDQLVDVLPDGSPIR